MAMAANVSASMVASQIAAANHRNDETSMLYRLDEDYDIGENSYPYTPTITRTTMGQPILSDSARKPLPKTSNWVKFLDFFTFNGRGKHRNRQLWG